MTGNRSVLSGWRAYLYVLPILVLSGLFLYYCIGFTVYTSFHSWNGIDTDMKFIGLDNYIKLFDDKSYHIALRNNLIFFVFTVGVQAALGLLLAVLLRAKLKGNSIFRSIYFIPTIMAPIIIAAIFRIIMDTNFGSLNEGLRAIGLDFLAVSWLGDPKYALMSIIIVNIFEWMGFSMTLYYSALLAIPDEIYESAKIDGSGFWRTLFKITVPLVGGTTSTLVILGIVGSLKTFDIVSLLTGGGPGRSTEFLTTYVYKKAIEEFNGGMSAAAGVTILIIALVLAVLQIQFTNRQQRDL
ncbi:sugar ABC transporter permease [Paenibacillus oryzae]|uniref:Sugar ABC transporter permease n=1 Tax=Paenibacillus oryzae TaxID=1844972 RepID=A0A1A5YS76_9BACL|nr:sugar ABC transporter permease [Paenibacillus oryzae]OBR68409.1 sugar ABC transporter permease [Paenibacillus oryzae]